MVKRLAQQSAWSNATFLTALAGAFAGLAGMLEVAAVHGRANASLIAGYGYAGILVAFLARHNPLAIIPVAVLLGGINASGEIQNDFVVVRGELGEAVGDARDVLELGRAKCARARVAGDQIKATVTAGAAEHGCYSRVEFQEAAND